MPASETRIALKPEFMPGDEIQVVKRPHVHGLVNEVTANRAAVGGFLYKVKLGENVTATFDCLGIEPVGTEQMWRDDRRDVEPLGESMDTVICANDTVDASQDYTLHVFHVDTIYGRGFRPGVRALRGTSAVAVYGDVIHGLSVRAHARAWEAGIDMLHRFQDELDKRLRGSEASSQ